MSKVKYMFTLLGMAMLLGALFCYYNTSRFLTSAIVTEGMVVGFQELRGESSSTYKPIVVFMTEDEETVKFTSSVGSGRPSYSKGDDVKVLYLSSDPQGAKLDGFFDLWGGVVILATVGSPFFLTGFLMLAFGRLKQRKRTSLRQAGMAVQARFQSVEVNYSLSVNGRNPYVICCQWLNPETQEVHMFESDNLWFNPSDHIRADSLTVFIEPGNPRKYHVDLSFLPRMAG
jgi:hypothetical protein